MTFLIVEVLDKAEEHKLVNFHGIELLIPKSHKYLTADTDGTISSFKHHPYCSCKDNLWDKVTPEWKNVGKCRFSGDWKESLITLED